MSNTWKARCAESNDYWEFGEIIEVVNGTSLDGEYHRWGGTNNQITKSFENWCKYQHDTKW